MARCALGEIYSRAIKPDDFPDDDYEIDDAEYFDDEPDEPVLINSVAEVDISQCVKKVKPKELS